ncbi:HotDog domain-containing protein [Biscogniauxia mediterranea]|nr:HotDog domain-containing protein [Biscogniauxia mediterranea]
MSTPTTNTTTTDPTPAPAPAPAPEPTDAQIAAHLTHLLRTRAPLSPLYDLLISGAGARIVRATRGAFAARLTLSRAHLNSAGTLHGAASAALVDWAGGMAVATTMISPDATGTGVSLDIHVRYLAASAREGDVLEVRGTADRVGGRVAFTSVGIWKVLGGKGEGEGEGKGDGKGEEWEMVASGTHTKYIKQR